jgi:hypothetical protein
MSCSKMARTRTGCGGSDEVEETLPSISNRRTRLLCGFSSPAPPPQPPLGQMHPSGGGGGGGNPDIAEGDYICFQEEEELRSMGDRGADETGQRIRIRPSDDDDDKSLRNNPKFSFLSLSFLVVCAIGQLMLLLFVLYNTKKMIGPAFALRSASMLANILEGKEELGGEGGAPDRLRNSLASVVRDSLRNATIWPEDDLQSDETVPTFVTSRHAAANAAEFCPAVSLSCPAVAEKVLVKILKKTLDNFLSTQYLVMFDIVGEYKNASHAGWGTWRFDKHPPKYPLPAAAKIPAWGNFCFRTGMDEVKASLFDGGKKTGEGQRE